MNGSRRLARWRVHSPARRLEETRHQEFRPSPMVSVRQSQAPASAIRPWDESPVTLDRPGQRGKHDGTREAHGQSAFLASSQPAYHFNIVLHVRHGIPRPLFEKLSHPRQPDTPRRTIEQRVPQDSLEALDLLTQRRLGHSQFLRCLAEMQRLGDRQKVAQVTKLDILFHMNVILIQMIKILDI